MTGGGWGRLYAVWLGATINGMRTFGRLLQQSALVILPLAMLMELTDALGRDVGVSDMVIMLVFGVLIFVLGRTLEGVANRGS